MREEGFVKAVFGDNCEIIIKRKTACGENCASCKAGCEAREQVCVAENRIGANVGDRVLIEIESTKVLKSAFLVYILPILVFLTVFIAVSEVGGNELYSALASVFASGVVFLGVTAYAKRHKKEYISKVVEII